MKVGDIVEINKKAWLELGYSPNWLLTPYWKIIGVTPLVDYNRDRLYLAVNMYGVQVRFSRKEILPVSKNQALAIKLQGLCK